MNTMKIEPSRILFDSSSTSVYLWKLVKFDLPVDYIEPP